MTKKIFTRAIVFNIYKNKNISDPNGKNGVNIDTQGNMTMNTQTLI